MRESSLEDFLGGSDGEATERTPSEDEPKPEEDRLLYTSDAADDS